MSEPCSQSWCQREHYAKGYCVGHYKRARAGRDMDMPFQRKGDYEAKFWERVNKSDECWEWSAGKTVAGYGHMRQGDSLILAHRFSFEINSGPIPAGMQVDHKCHNRACVRPDHLRLATDGLNKQNQSGAHRNSKSGIRGVSWSSRRRKWIAQAGLDGRQNYLGGFDAIEEAEKVVIAWRQANMPYSLMDRERKAS